MTKKPMSNSDGCLWIFISMIFTIIGFGVIKIVTNVTDLLAIFLAVLISLAFTVRILGKPSLKMIFRQGAFLIIFLVAIRFMGMFFVSIIKDLDDDRPSFTEEERVTNAVLIENNDTIPVYTSNRFWNDSFGNNFNGPLTVRERDYIKLKNHISSFRPPSGRNFWGNLYEYIDATDSPSLDLIMDMFTRINSEKKLNQMEFADMVVTCIQDIPYSFVFQETCMPSDYYEDSIRHILEDCPECCIGNVLYGIQNPVSFIQNLKGDCDTRTVLIYSILKHFNYDVAILNSDFYKHSILGLNLPASGLTKIHNGKKYVLWETTAKYFGVGVLPNNFNDIKHWNVVLTSK
jgi:hypothetical protein